MRGSGLRALLRGPAFVYVQLLRGVPLLVFLYWVYFGLAIVVGVASAHPGGDHRAHRTGSAYTAEIFRAASSTRSTGSGGGRDRARLHPPRDASCTSSFRR